MKMKLKKKEKGGDLNNMSDYTEETENNRKVFMQTLQHVDPVLYVIKDTLLKTEINPLVILKVLRQLNNIGKSTGWGNINIVIQDGVVKYVEGKTVDLDKVEQPIITENIDNL